MNATASTTLSLDQPATELVRGADGRLLQAILPTFLPLATQYQRAVGYFSGSVFEAAPLSFWQFFAGGGRMEIVCYPMFREGDLKTLYQALYGRQQGKAQELSSTFDWTQNPIRYRSLTWAVRHNLLSIRIAVFKDQRVGSVYHEKIGLLALRDGRFIAIDGSANESANAYKHNFERILIHEVRPTIPVAGSLLFNRNGCLLLESNFA